ncbi:TPA: autotransporter-associated beta strand repeat-containing protein [Escherichia coli]
MTHSISGSGDVTKLGTGILTLNNDSAAYQGTTDIVGGKLLSVPTLPLIWQVNTLISITAV